MEAKLNVTISIEGTPVPHFSTFALQQRFNEHHAFELRFNHDQLGMPGMINLDQAKDFIGKNLTAEFSRTGGKEHLFTGKVTQVSLSQSHGYHGVVVVKGFSPTILLDRGPDLGSYLNKSLADIVRKATEDAPSNDLALKITPTRTNPIDYLIQYRESDYAFLNRLSAEYHEWFYYDGVSLQFGKPASQDEVSLVYGRDVHSLEYGINIAPLKYKRFAYHPQTDELLQSESQGQADGSPDLAHAVKASNEVFSKVYNQPSPIRVNNKSDMDSLVSNESKSLISDLLRLKASGDNPQVKLGSIVDIAMSVRQGIGDFSTESLGKFLVTAVFHELDGVGHYSNSFEAVAANTERIPTREYEKPEPDLQLADVVENDDPQHQGRIKVKFKWQCSCNDVTEWLRVVSPNAGNGDTGGNRGFFVIPEKGDQVVVAFEEGNIARPVVMGSVYSGKTANSGAFTNSNTKAMNSRKGSTLTFDDKDHFILLQTDATNNLKIEKSGNKVSITANDEIVFTTGDSKLTMKKDGTIEIYGKKSVTVIGQTDAVHIQSNKLVDVIGKNKVGITSDTLVETQAAKLSSTGKQQVEVNSKLVNVSGATKTDIKGGLLNLNC